MSLAALLCYTAQRYANGWGKYFFIEWFNLI